MEKTGLNTRPRVSVIMPVYNTAIYLKEAIESILNQTFVDFEFIIIDDCSTDNSLEIIKSYKDPRIVLIENNVNKGYVYGLNYAISISKGEFIARMDSDDISEINRLQIQYSFMLNNEGVLVCGTNIKIIGTSEIIKFPKEHNDIKKGLLTKNIVAHPSVMAKKRLLLFRETGTYLENLMPAEDYELWTRLIFLGKFHNIQLPLVLYRKHENQISNSKSDVQYENFKLINRKYILKYCNELSNVEIKKRIIFNDNLGEFEYLNHLKTFLKINKKYLSEDIKVVLQNEMFEITKQILSLRENNSIKGIYKLLFQYPTVIFNSNYKLILGYIKRVLLFSFFPQLRRKSIYLK
jgi:glycosyltransferase involved in cell wall biosynthesis